MSYEPDRGDVVWAVFGPRTGHEQAGRRPGLIISPRAYNSASGLVLMCPITSKRKGYPFEVALSPGVATSGVVLSDQVRSFDWRARRIQFREHAPQDVMEQVLARIAAILGLTYR